MIDNQIKYHKSTIKLNNDTSLVDIQHRNENYRKFKHDSQQASDLRAVTESTYAVKIKNEGLHNSFIVPKVVTKLSNQYHKIMPEIILREYFTALVTESLVWDKEDVTDHMDSLRYACHKYIANIGGLEAVREAADRNKSTYLGHVYDVCMEAGKKIAAKKSKKLKKNATADNIKNQQIDFTIETADKDDINKKIDSLDVDGLSELVKNKVLQVVKDENESQKQDDTFIQDLKTTVKSLDGNVDLDGDSDPNATAPTDATDANGDTVDSDAADYGDGADASDAGEGTTESFTKYAHGGKLDVQRSLFRSMFMRSMSSATKEHFAAMTEGVHANFVATKNNSDKSDPLDNNLRDQPNNLNIYDIYLNDGGEDLGYIDFVKNSDEPAIAGDDTEIDSDEVLAEALAMYTIIECASTIKLINPDKRAIKRVIAINEKK